MIDDNFRKISVQNHLEGVTKLVEGSNWEKPTKLNIAKNLVEKIEELLDGKVSHYVCCDKTTQHEKIVIEYNHTKK